MENYQAGRCVITRFFDPLVTEQTFALLNTNELPALWMNNCLLNLYVRMLAPNVLLERGGIRHVLFADSTVLGKIFALLRSKAEAVRRCLQLHCLSSREQDQGWA